MTDADESRRSPTPGASWRALGTSVHLLVTADAALPAARVAVAAQLDAIDRAASRFRPDSELSRLNNSDGSPREVSPLFGRALRVALDTAAGTGGLVDPTVGRSLVDLGYDRTFQTVAARGPAVTIAVRPAPGPHHLQLTDGDTRARLTPGVLLDLGATAKALAVDLAVQAAYAASGCGVLVNLGGDLATAGPAPDGGWPVLVTDDSAADPESGDGQTVVIHAGGLATSGVRARRWQRGGAELHHLIDPRSGAPAAGPWRTASVAATTCVLANAASTAAMILGDAAPRWLTDRGLAARLVRHDGATVVTPGWPIPPTQAGRRP